MVATIEPVKIELLQNNQSLPEREAILTAFAEHYRAGVQRARERAAAPSLATPDFGDVGGELPSFHELAAVAEESAAPLADPAGPPAAGTGGDEPLAGAFAGASDYELDEDPFGALEVGGGTYEDMPTASLFDADAFGESAPEAPQLFAAFDDPEPAPVASSPAAGAAREREEDAPEALAAHEEAAPAAAEAVTTVAADAEEAVAEGAPPVEAAEGDGAAVVAAGAGADEGPKTRQSRRSRRKSKKGTKA